MASRPIFLGLTVITALCIAALYLPILHRATVLGLTRSQASIQNTHTDDQLIYIRNTVHCEDLHYHAASNKLYTACEGDASTRKEWFPPMGHFVRRERYDGGIVVIDPLTFKSITLELIDFPGPLITHGIDVFPSYDNTSLTIFAVNHLPNPVYDATQLDSETNTQARSQVEIFTHPFNSSTATWIRSVSHPLIRTPNDLLATSPTSFYVTNDHHYRFGWRRFAEDLLEYHTAGWSDVVHVAFDTDLNGAAGVTASVAARGFHNPNGLGRSGEPGEVLLTSAAGGELYVLTQGVGTDGVGLRLRERIRMESAIDNPSWYQDDWTGEGRDASGYILAGVLRGTALEKAVMREEEPIPVVVWHVDAGGAKRVLFRDEGYRVRSASAAVVMGIEPRDGGRKEGWLWVTGFVSGGVVAVKVDLDW